MEKFALYYCKLICLNENIFGDILGNVFLLKKFGKQNLKNKCLIKEFIFKIASFILFKQKYCSLKMDNIIVTKLKALAGRVLKCRVSWPRAKNVKSAGHLLKMSSQLVT